jgi:hypothetical protein
MVIKRDSICSLLWPWELPVLRQIKLAVYHGVLLLGTATHTDGEEVNCKTSEKGGKYIPLHLTRWGASRSPLVTRRTYVLK